MTTVRATSVGWFTRAIGLRVTVVLLLAVVAVTAVGALLPAEHGVFDSWWYVILLGLVGAQTALCTVARGRTALVQVLTPGRFRPEGLGPVRAAGGVPAAARLAREWGYRVVAAPRGSLGGEVVLVRGRLQPFGFLVLHVGLLALTAGVIWNLQAAPPTSLVLSPGGRVLDRESGLQYEVAAVRPQAVRPGGDAGGWRITSIEADLRVYRGADLVAQGTARLGSPLEVDGAEVALLPVLGRYQVTVGVQTPDGRRLEAPITSDDPELGFPGTGLAVEIEDFSPDARIGSGGTWQRESPLLRSPFAAVSLVDPSSGSVLAGGDLRPGGSLRAAGYTVTLVKADYMPTVVVSRREGRLLLLGGGAAVLLGMVLASLFSYRQLWLRPSGEGIEVRGYARRRHQPLEDEVATLVEGSAGPPPPVGQAAGDEDGASSVERAEDPE